MPRITTLAGLLAEELGIATYTEETSAQAGVAAAQLMPQNPNRIGWVLQNLSAATLYLRPGRAPTSTVGIILASNEWRSMLYREDFALVSLQWQILASAAAADYYLLEVLLLGRDRPAP
jgi:hypothetical protein